MRTHLCREITLTEILMHDAFAHKTLPLSECAAFFEGNPKHLEMPYNPMKPIS
jgi:hypothetical protein